MAEKKGSRNRGVSKKADEAMYHGDERYRILVETAGAGIGTVDTEGNLTFVNARLCQLTGYSKEDVLGRPFADFVHKDDLPHLMEAFLDAVSGIKQSEILEFRLIRKDGQNIWVHGNPEPIVIDGQANEYSAIIYDISDRKRLEESLAKSEERYRSILDQMQDTYHEVDLAGNFTFLSESAALTLGYLREELTGQSYRIAMPDEEFRRTFAAFNDVYRTGQPNKGFTCRILHKDGSKTFAEISIDLNRNTQSEVIGFKVVSRDITGRRKVEEELRESEEKYRLLVETASEVILVVQDFKIKFFNRRAVELSGYSADELQDMPFTALIYPDDLEMIADRHRRRMQGEPFQQVYPARIVHKSGIVVWAEISVVPMNWEGRSATLGLLSDITERKRTEEALRESEERFRRLSENAQDVIYRFSLKPVRGFEYVSPACVKLTGYTPEEFYADPLLARKIVHPEDRDQHDRHFRSLSSSGTPLTLRLMHKAGYIVWEEEIDVPVYTENGELIAYEGIVRDITIRKQFESALQESEKSYRRLADYHKQLNEVSISFSEAAGIQDLFNKIAETFRDLSGSIASTFSLYDQENRDLRVVSLSIDPESNEKVSSTFGPGLYEMRMPVSTDVMEQMLSQVIRRPKDLHELSFGVMPQDISDAVMDAVGCKQIVALALSYAAELVGTCISYLPSDKPVVPDDALKTYAYVAGMAVKRKKADDELRESEARYRLLSEHTTDVIWVVNRDLKTTYISPSVQNIRGFTPAEIMEMPPEKHLTPESLKSALELLFKELPKVDADPGYNPVHVLELEFYRRDGTTVWTESKFSVIRDENSRPISMLCETRDITERLHKDEALKASEARYRLLSEHTTDSVWLMDMNLKTTYHSPASEKVRGYTPQEVMDLPLDRNLTPESLKLASELFLEELPRVIADPDYNPVRTIDLEYYCKDGTIKWAENKFSIIRDENRNPVSILGEARDINERKKADEALKSSLSLLSASLESTADGILIVDRNGNIAQWNQKFADMWNIPEEVLSSHSDEKTINHILTQLIDPEQFVSKVRKLYQQPAESSFDRIDFLDGRVFERYSQPQIIEGNIVGRVWSFRDITEGRKAEEAIRESERRFKSIVEHVTDIFYMQNTDRQMLYVSPQVEQVLGYTLEDMRSNWQSYLTANPINLVADEISRLAITTGIKQPPYMLEFIGRDGVKRLAEMNESPFKNASGEVIGIVGAARDMTERIRIESALKESEEKYRMVVENAMEAIFIDVNGILKFGNRRTTELTGYSLEEFSSRSLMEFIHTDDRQMIVTRYRQRTKGVGVPNIYSFRLICKSGYVMWVEVSEMQITWEGRPANLNFMTDITDRKRLEEEQQRVEKLESIGLLAGGIAHDFNNILTAILGNISLARTEADPGSEILESLDQAEKASLRARDLTQQLLTFSKGGAPVKKLASLTELLRDTVGFALRGSNVSCTFSIPDDLWHAEIDAGQVSQVIHNLVINAQQTMPTGGTIEITAENITLSEEQSLRRGLPLKGGNYVRISVIDHGSGIPAEHLAKIFDPFFTTKQKGSGLGLATSFSIARHHGGHLSVESELGAGSTFYLYLPASMKTSVPGQGKKEKIKTAGKARILVMDDEKGVRHVAGRMLKNIGYEDVEFAVDGTEAVRRYKEAMESGRPFRLVILDLTIPGGMGGREAIKQLLEVDPGVTAIVSSGYADESVMAEFKEYGFRGMVAKPYSIEQLGKAVHDVLG